MDSTLPTWLRFIVAVLAPHADDRPGADRPWSVSPLTTRISQQAAWLRCQLPLDLDLFC